MITSELSDELCDASMQITNFFQGPSSDSNEDYKWTLLKDYYFKYLVSDNISLSLLSSYTCIVSTLLESLKPTLFKVKWQEDLFDDVILNGIHHETLILLVRKLGENRESYQQEKVLSLLEKFLCGKSLTLLLQHQCLSCGMWDPKYLALSKTWNDLITCIVSLPERVANKTKGQMHKIFCIDYYIPLLISSMMKVLTTLHQKINENQNCTLEFFGKLLGKLCVLGHSETVSRRLFMELLKRCEKDFVWRRLSQNLITKMPFCSLEPLVTHLLLMTPWYGYLEWILGDEGMKNQQLNYLMSEKLLLIRVFQKEIILYNIIGYFASINSRLSCFWTIFGSLAQCWSDKSVQKHQNFEQQKYIASALIICTGWMKGMKDVSNARTHLIEICNGTSIRIGSSDERIRNLALIVGNLVTLSIEPGSPVLDCNEIVNEKFLEEMQKLSIVPSDPGKEFLFLEDINVFEEIESEEKEKADVNKRNAAEPCIANLEIDSDDDLEPYDTSKDIPQEQTKRPFYLNDCLQGLIEQESDEWFEQCLKHAENLIVQNSDKVHEIAVEMAKVMLHLEDRYAIPDFLTLRHRILVSLTVHCPILVAEYLASQFYEDNYNIRQRLDILEVLAVAAQKLSQPKSGGMKAEPTVPHSREKLAASTEKMWRTIVDQRVAAKTRYITKTKRNPLPEMIENQFSPVAGYFFFPLLAKYDKSNKMLKLFGEDSYVLGRLIYTLGTIIHAAANIPICQQMGEAFLQFLADVRNHSDGFVREASIFAMATVFTSVPGYLLFSDDMSPLVFDSKDWLQNVIDNDQETNCQVKATYALSIILQAVQNEMPLVREILSANEST